jgi:hypothetical protein
MILVLYSMDQLKTNTIVTLFLDHTYCNEKVAFLEGDNFSSILLYKCIWNLAW